MSTQCATPQANKENSGDDKAHANITPSSIETSASSTSSISKQRVIFSKRNQEHFFEPVLAANPTPLSTQEPSKSILKKRSYDEFLADDALFGSLVPQRSSTPEPETEEGLAAYLLSPVTTLAQSVQSGRAEAVNNQDIIEAYCVLTARIRAKFLPTAILNGANQEGPELPKGLHPAMRPVQDYVDHLVCAITRDIARAREDPLKDFSSNPATDKPLAEGDINAAAATLPSPPSSSPSPFDPQATPKRSGMNEQQVKHARDLCTISQSAMKLLAALFCFPEIVQSGELFTETHLSTLLSALLAIPLSSPLPTPNSRKTSALSITLLTAFSTLFSSCDTPFSAVIGDVISPNIAAITCSLRRGIDGELGREGKKGAAADSLRAVISFSRGQPDFFAAPFSSAIIPSLMKLLSTGSGSFLQSQAGNALAAVAGATIKAQVNTAELKFDTTGELSNATIGAVMRSFFVLKPPKTKGGDLQLSAVLLLITKYFQTLNAVYASRDAASTAYSKEEAAKREPSANLQQAAHMSAMWALMVFSSIIVLTDGCLFRPATKTMFTTGEGAGPATTTAKVIRTLLASKRVAIRTAASYAWKAFTWAILREFERMDEEEPNPEASDASEGRDDDDEEKKYTKHQGERMDLLRRSFDFVDKGVGVGVICALLVGSAGREDREMRVDLAVEALLEMARRKSSAGDAAQVLRRLMSIEGVSDNEDEEGGPSLGWDINKILPASLFDGRLAEADSKWLLVLAREEREASGEADWVNELLPVSRSEGRDRWDTFYEVWLACAKAQGIDDKAMPSTLILQGWTVLLQRSSRPPSKQFLVLLDEQPHLWLNAVDPADNHKQNIAHRAVQARVINALWKVMVKRFGPTKQMKKLALDIYDRGLSLFHFGPGAAKVQDECLELFFVLAEIESSIIFLVMEHEGMEEAMKREFWASSSVSAPQSNEEILRALTIAPFGAPQPFDFTDKDWKTWEDLWLLYMGTRGDAPGSRLDLQRLFAEQLAGNLSAREVSRIASSILGTLPLPIKPSADVTSLFTLINQSLIVAYQSADLEIMEMATSTLRKLTSAFPELTEECFSLVTPSLIAWISDPEGLLTDKDYDLISGSTYEAALQFIRTLPTNEETLAEHSELLGCITNRITANMGTLRAFRSLWTEGYAEMVAFDNAPASLCPLLLVMDSESSFSQETEEASQLPPASEDEEEFTEDESFEPRERERSFELPDPDTSSSFGLSPPPTPPSDTETLEEDSEDPLSVVAPASEAPEENDSDQQSTNRLTRWTGSYEDLSQQVTAGNRAVQSPYYKAAKPHERYAFSFQSPEGPIPGLGLYTASTSAFSMSPRHPSLNASATRSSTNRFASTSSAEPLSPTSPNSRKRRAWEDDGESGDQAVSCTPVKRRKQEKDDSDEDSDDDRTPIRPWFDADCDHEKADIPGLASVPFQPFTRNNLPKGPYRFSGQASFQAPTEETLTTTTASQRSTKAPVKAINGMLGQGAVFEKSQTFFVNTARLERNNPSAKRRRVIEPPVVQTPLSLQLVPYSDEIEPSSDDVKSDPPPSSDDTITSGGISPHVIVSPAMVSGEPGSDESTESPLKAHLDRKKRLQASKLRAESSQAGFSSLRGRSSVPSQAKIVDIQARQAMVAACHLMPSMDEAGLARMSSFLEQMHAKVQDELRRKSESESE